MDAPASARWNLGALRRTRNTGYVPFSINVPDHLCMRPYSLGRVAISSISAHARSELADLFSDRSPLVPEMVPAYELYPGPPTGDVVLVVSGVTKGDDWCSYVWQPSGWVEVDCREDNPQAIYVAVLGNSHARLQKEHKELLAELSQARLDGAIIRHELERTKSELQALESKRAKTVPFFIKVIIIAFALSFLVGRAYADPVEDLKKEVAREIDFVRWLIQSGYLSGGLAFFSQHAFWALSVAAMLWWLCSSGMSLWRLVCSSATVLLAVATNQRWSMVAALPYQTDASVLVLCFAGVISMVSHVLALLFMLVILLLTPVACVLVNDADLYRNVVANVITTCLMVLSFCANACGFDMGIVGICFCFFRIYALFLANASSDKIEIKLGNKVVATATPRGFFQRMKRGFSQLRVGAQPLMRVRTEAICQIKNGDVSGTGFFVSNWVVTAAHVAAGPGTTIVVAGKTYPVIFDKEIPGKDIALFKIPSDLNEVPRLKVSRKHAESSWCTIVSPADGGCHQVCVSQCFACSDTLSYTCATQNGMSGAPVLDADGRVLGVHHSNTGYTGAASCLYVEDVTPKSPKDEEIARLRKEIESLKSGKSTVEEKDGKVALEQRDSGDDVVDLIRVAVGNEMKILRQELARDLGLPTPEVLESYWLEKKKGKTKSRARGHAAKRGRPKKWLTEEDYELLQQEAGGDRQLLMELLAEMVAERWGKTLDGEDLDPESSDDETGFYFRHEEAEERRAKFRENPYDENDETGSVDLEEMSNTKKRKLIKKLQESLRQAKNASGPQKSGGQKRPPSTSGPGSSNRAQGGSSQKIIPSSDGAQSIGPSEKK